MDITRRRGHAQTLVVALICAITLLFSMIVISQFAKWRPLLAIPVIAAPLAGGAIVILLGSRAKSLPTIGSPLHVPLFVVFWYFVIGSFFACAFKAASKLGSQIVTSCGECIQGFFNLIYYSVVTASTLGYGDLKPVGWVARFLVCAEVIEFWFFLALAVFLIQDSLNQCLATRGGN